LLISGKKSTFDGENTFFLDSVVFMSDFRSN